MLMATKGTYKHRHPEQDPGIQNAASNQMAQSGMDLISQVSIEHAG